MEKIVFLDSDSLLAKVRAPAFAHHWQTHGATDGADVVARLQGATIAITNKVPLRAEAIARLPDLKMIAVAATGSDNIDLAACRARGIVVSNIRDYSLVSVPEHCVAALHSTQAPKALHSVPPFWLQAVSIGLAGCAGAPLVHTSLVHWEPSSAGTSPLALT